ncbi:MAG: hypothetical protein ACRDYU_06730 [Actinomycetes bacterium]
MVNTMGKADFAGIYNQPDARAYYKTLGSLGYEIPQCGADVVSQLLDRWQPDNEGDDPRTVLDVCCSYGVGGALLKTDLSLDDLYAHYREADEAGLEGDDLVEADRRLLTEHRLPDAPRVLGLDAADQAVRYAVTTGALDDGAAQDLESQEPRPSLAGLMTDVDLISTTGGVGYVTERTFERLLEASDRTPWVAAFCLREYDYAPIADTLRKHGLTTERADKTFRQRRFRDAQERDWALSQLRARGLDPEGMETDGHYHAEFFLSRPADDIAAQPLEQLLPDVVDA